MDHIRGTILATPSGQEKYDTVCKELLSNRQIMSRVLKRFAKEYENCSADEIERCYMEPESIFISKEAVERNQTNRNLTGSNTEDSTINEGTIYYDIMFGAIYPKGKDQMVGMIINVEAQNDFYPGYEIESRGIYYAARKLSSELRVINRNTNYSDLKKVYSIWICIGENVPEKEANTVSLYEIAKNDIIGNVERDMECYELLSVIIIRISDKTEAKDPVLALMQLLFSGHISKEEKLQRLEEMGLRMDDTLVKGVNTMCTLAQGLVESTAKKVTMQVTKQVTEQVTEQVTKQMAINMYKKQISIKEIAEITGVSIVDIRNWLKEESERPS